jgi:hypothetical protein
MRFDADHGARCFGEDRKMKTGTAADVDDGLAFPVQGGP